ncbi:TadE/TadG family type IV pilus assembly protein [Paenibacillus roseipurpureus]|uniref:TadE/TadG family type IV pilus assembly protein n=1 Tax=Paenibacillus roseopurpureus TaxID=2918901 RepID=A0AA96LJJ5_9BACL|nr:TadE/TadG family type IV pilus assembly protein [Paenibacillus sp. MBLB1832]WNR42252.1 TadE/TadG family type IV pilus assembly protein [Paenibacillus sp. MBLB1832]
MRHKRTLRFVRNEQGSFTLEASLVFPMILLCTVALLFIGVYTYQHVYMQQLATTTAEKLAFTWDNSHKELETGSFRPEENDGLYWRLTQDDLSDLFGLLRGSGGGNLALPFSSATSLVDRKLARASNLLPQGVTGEASYSNYFLDHQVKVRIQRSFLMPAYVRKWLGKDRAEGAGVSHVVDAVELIRTTDLTRTYLLSLVGVISPAKAKAALIEPVNNDMSGPAVIIRSEREAASYLRSLVGGTAVVRTTASGKSRTIDALDARGIGHQAFYSMTEAQLRLEQMPKDVELLKKDPSMKGIVWHFFKKDASGKGMPTNAFRQELERNGIVVVIHN